MTAKGGRMILKLQYILLIQSRRKTPINSNVQVHKENGFTLKMFHVMICDAIATINIKRLEFC